MLASKPTTTHNLMFGCVLAVLSSLATAIPNPAVNRIDVVAPKSHSTKSHHSTITSPPTATAIHASLEARNPAIGHLVDIANNPRPQSTTAPVSASTPASIASDACEPFGTLVVRNPTVNSIDAIGFHSVSVDTADKPRCSILDGSTPFLEVAVQLEARHPAVNRIDAVGQVVKGQSILSLAGGSPVTLDADEVKELKAAATEPPTIAASIPLISANPTANAGIPAAYFASASASPSATASHEGVRFNVPDTRTTLYLYYHEKQVIPKLDLGQILAEAMVELRQTIAKIGRDGPIPYDDWSFLRQKWDCIVLCESNPAPRSGGRQQHLTYGILHSTMAGLWGALYSKGNYFGADFEIWDGAWGWVGSGNIVPWQKGLQIGEGGNVTTS